MVMHRGARVTRRDNHQREIHMSDRSLRGLLIVVLALVLPATAHAAPRLSLADLIANLKSPNADTRQDAVQELGRRRRREGVAPLAAAVRDPEPKVRLEVVRALRLINDLSAVAALTMSLEDGDPAVRKEAVATLVQLYTGIERPTALGRFLDIFSDTESGEPTMAAPVDPLVISGLARRLGDDEADVRKQSAIALGLLRGSRAADSLRRALSDPVDDVRAASVAALQRIGSRDADGEALIPLLGDESSMVRQRAVSAVAALKVRAAAPALRQLYESTRRREANLRALDALARVEDPNQELLFKQLVQDPDPERRRLAVEGLARVSDSSMLTPFKKDYQREKDDGLRLAYAFALTRLGDHAFIDSLVLCLPSRTLGRRCKGYVLELGRELLGEIYLYLSDPDAEIRAELCDVIASIGDEDSIRRLTPLVGDPSSKVADHANRAVERLKRRLAGEAAG